MSSKTSINLSSGSKSMATGGSILNDLVDSTFTLYLVSPLFNFKLERDFLRKISIECTQQIREMDNSMALDIQLGKRKQAKIIISVEAGLDTVYEAHLFNCNCQYFQHPKNVVILPFMCVTRKSSSKIEKEVLAFIGNKFLCVIKNCELSDLQLQWLMGISVNETLRRNLNDGCTVTYVNPNLDSVTLSVDWESTALAAIWEQCTADEEENIISYMSISKLISAMQEHVQHTFEWDISSYSLKRMQLFGLEIHQDGSLIMAVPHSEILNAIFMYLHAECVESNPLFRLTSTL